MPQNFEILPRSAAASKLSQFGTNLARNLVKVSLAHNPCPPNRKLRDFDAPPSRERRWEQYAPPARGNETTNTDFFLRDLRWLICAEFGFVLRGLIKGILVRFIIYLWRADCPQDMRGHATDTLASQHCSPGLDVVIYGQN